MLVKERMTPPAVTIMLDTQLADAAKLMQERQYRRLPVLNSSEALVGIVTDRDLHGAALHFHESLVGVKEIMIEDKHGNAVRMLGLVLDLGDE